MADDTWKAETKLPSWILSEQPDMRRCSSSDSLINSWILNRNTCTVQQYYCSVDMPWDAAPVLTAWSTAESWTETLVQYSNIIVPLTCHETLLQLWQLDQQLDPKRKHWLSLLLISWQGNITIRELFSPGISRLSSPVCPSAQQYLSF